MENAIAQEVMSPPAIGAVDSHVTDWYPSPDEIHEAMAVLIAAENWAAANEMSMLAQVLHPSSEKVLIICALLAEVQQDWANAYELLKRLEALQGALAPVHTFHHQVRVLRCLGELESALAVACDCQAKFPLSDEIAAEISGLQELMQSRSSADVSFHPI